MDASASHQSMMMKALDPPSPDTGREAAPAFFRDGLLKGQPALVTGASSGIGHDIALELARAGCDVAINYSSHSGPAEELAHTVEAMGRRALPIKADVSREDEVTAMFERAIAHFGSLHIAVSNAGVQHDAPLLDMTLDQWHSVIGINLTGQFLCGRQAAREFKRRGVDPAISKAAGKIICMSSVHDVIPWAGHANYAASKGGVSALMKTMAQELAPHRIRVNAISPGAIRTPINAEAWQTPEAYANLMRLVPYGRIGEPGDIGAAAVWLACDASDYMTGATLYVDGGMTLYPEFAGGG